jgi:hypothetical protein
VGRAAVEHDRGPLRTRPEGGEAGAIALGKRDSSNEPDWFAVTLRHLDPRHFHRS